jgi:hypothetical protein
MFEVIVRAIRSEESMKTKSNQRKIRKKGFKSKRNN